jgi:aldose 1-epimerase
MAFSVDAQGDKPIWILADGAGGRAEVWPSAGFNCYFWHVARNGQLLDLLYADPDFLTGGRPTRSGIPILFPFPNRIHDGRFTWSGKQYQLPLNDGPQRNAIHGFVVSRPWRVVDSGKNEASAWVMGAFQRSVDAPDISGLWPADYEIRVTYRLGSASLRIEAEVHNPDTVPLPFGLGYHPYFRMPFVPGIAANDCTVQMRASSLWQLAESLPTGQKSPPDVARDLNQPRRFTELNLDDVYTDLDFAPRSPDGLIEHGAIHCGEWTLRLFSSMAFREMVLYTPGHRQAICLEPYTCATDAVNLQARGIEAGWMELKPGGHYTFIVEMRLDQRTV